MTNSSQDILRQLFLIDYSELKRQLTRRLGSEDRAADALHDAWLRLEEAAPIGPIHRPFPYLLRVAYHLALKRRQKERERVTLDDARDSLDLTDEAPSPERVAAGRSDLYVVRQALAELTPRRREILLAARTEGVPVREIAARHNISQRMAELELKAALLHCGRRLGRKVIQRFGPRSSDGSREEQNDE
jgi:RNA polymerase sigma-70 factor, ECF subfamily